MDIIYRGLPYQGFLCRWIALLKGVGKVYSFMFNWIMNNVTEYLQEAYILTEMLMDLEIEA